jgi:hypothetical protein
MWLDMLLCLLLYISTLATCCFVLTVHINVGRLVWWRERARRPEHQTRRQTRPAGTRVELQLLCQPPAGTTTRLPSKPALNVRARDSLGETVFARLPTRWPNAGEQSGNHATSDDPAVAAAHASPSSAERDDNRGIRSALTSFLPRSALRSRSSSSARVGFRDEIADYYYYNEVIPSGDTQMKPRPAGLWLDELPHLDQLSASRDAFEDDDCAGAFELVLPP